MAEVESGSIAACNETAARTETEGKGCCSRKKSVGSARCTSTAGYRSRLRARLGRAKHCPATRAGGGRVPYCAHAEPSEFAGPGPWPKEPFQGRRGNRDVARQELDRDQSVEASLRTVERPGRPSCAEAAARPKDTVRFEKPTEAAVANRLCPSHPPPGARESPFIRSSTLRASVCGFPPPALIALAFRYGRRIGPRRWRASRAAPRRHHAAGRFPQHGGPGSIVYGGSKHLPRSGAVCRGLCALGARANGEDKSSAGSIKK